MARIRKTEGTSFGDRLAAYRQACGLTQIALAEKLNMSQQMMDYYERKAGNPSADFLINVAKILNVSVDELLGIKNGAIKPGPAAKIERQLEKIRELPVNKQKVVSEILDTFIQASESASA